MEVVRGLVSIITVNFNGFQDTCELIDSLTENEPYSHEIIVVDNASRNDEAKKLADSYSHIQVVSNQVNLGFAGGNNKGYLLAKGEYVLFLNNDIIITRPFLQQLVERLESGKVGLVTPKIMYEEDRSRIQFAGFTPLSPISLRNYIIGTGEVDEGQYDEAKQTPYVHGAAMMGKKEVIDRVGLMTDVYFLFYEELDWSVQFRKSGYDLWYEPAATVYHKECMTAKRGSPLRLYYMTRARLLFARLNIEGVNKWLSCLYLSTFPLCKNSLYYLLRCEWGHLSVLWKGSWKGLTDSLK